MKAILLVALGGAAGSVLRYAMGLWLKAAPGATFPLATFGVNLAGSFLIGLLAGWITRGALSEGVSLLLVTGLCGGFTTFSAFSLEGMRMLQSGAVGTAVLYIGGSTVLGIALCMLGYKLAV